MGIMYSVLTNTKVELLYCNDLIHKHTTVLQSSSFSYASAWIYATTVAIPAITYSFVTLCLERCVLTNVQTPFAKVQLQTDRFHRDTLHKLANTPKLIIGLGIPRLFFVHWTKYTTHMIQHIKRAFNWDNKCAWTSCRFKWNLTQHLQF